MMVTDEKLVFYACGRCGAMFMENFRDSSCLVCHAAMKVTCVEVHNIGGGGLEVVSYPAPHEEEVPA